MSARFHSLGDPNLTASLAAVIRDGVAPDGALYAPTLPPPSPDRAFDPDLDAPCFAARLLAPFFEGDRLETDLAQICREALDIPTPLTKLPGDGSDLYSLSLHEGPTGAFKDFGARFLAACLERLTEDGERLTVLAATSGDTGGAVGCAVEGRARIGAIILYPKGRVSAFQEHQLTCWRPPVRALEVAGDFDACQRLVKRAFADRALSRKLGLTSANSINLGRLLPQMTYLAHAAARVREETGARPGLVIPTGNLGHGVAALYARAMGAPIGPVLLATNANPALGVWARTGRYRPRPAIATIANAMDVGAPSNFERLIALPARHRAVQVARIPDDAIRTRIVADHARAGHVWCPHSAAGAEAYARLPERGRRARPWILAETAHPFKFADLVEPLIGRTIAPSPALAAVLTRPTASIPIGADDDGFRETLAAMAEPKAR